MFIQHSTEAAYRREQRRSEEQRAIYRDIYRMHIYIYYYIYIYTEYIDRVLFFKRVPAPGQSSTFHIYGRTREKAAGFSRKCMFLKKQEHSWHRQRSARQR
jgi:hypothetical protein